MAQKQANTGVGIVTGATGGMGAASAARLAAQGWPLILCDLHQAPLEEQAAAFRARGVQAEILAGDIADKAFPTRLIAALAGRPIGALIHTAGVSPTMADAKRIFEINYDASMRLVEAVRPQMAKGACAVLISSSSAHLVVSPEIDEALRALKPGQDSSSLFKFATQPQLSYPISKRALIFLVAREAAAFGERGARIVSISPGLIDTKMGRAEQAASPQMDAMLAATPLKRYGVADEIASAAAFLCSPDASYITGCDIRVDGGTLAALGK